MEDKERTILERKRKVREALEEGKPIPTELRNEEAKLRDALAYDDEEHEELSTHVDDEYAWAGVEDPRVVITTSHNPSSKLKQFAKEFKLLIPNAQRMNRGNYVIGQLVHACKANNITDLIILHEHRGEPNNLVVSHLPYGPTASFTISNTVMRHDIPEVGTMSEASPHLIFHNFTSRLGKRATNILKYLFPVPKPDSRRVMTFANNEDYISFRHHTYKKSNGKEIELKEVGPRFELKLYEIRLGTVDQPDADLEWKLRPYMNTAKKRFTLTDTKS